MNKDTCPHQTRGYSIASGAWCKDCGAFLNENGQTWTMESDFCREECMGRCAEGACRWPPRPRYSNGPKKYDSLEEFLKT